MSGLASLADTDSLSKYSPWIGQPATEKAIKYLCFLHGYDGPDLPDEIDIKGQIVLVRTLSKGQVGALM